MGWCDDGGLGQHYDLSERVWKAWSLRREHIWYIDGSLLFENDRVSRPIVDAPLLHPPPLSSFNLTREVGSAPVSLGWCGRRRLVSGVDNLVVEP